jgi:hypothetical protein
MSPFFPTLNNYLGRDEEIGGRLQHEPSFCWRCSSGEFRKIYVIPASG